MGNALETKCPYCLKLGKHKVSKTDCKRYKWDDETDAIFKARLGEGLSYRLRTRECDDKIWCKRKFDTVEMSWDYLKIMAEALANFEQSKNEQKRLQYEVESLKEEITLLQGKKTDLEAQLRIQEEKYRGLVAYWKAAPIEQNSSSHEDEPSVENEEKEDDHLWG